MYEAYLRMLHPQPVQGTLMLIIAAIGLVANIVGAFVLIRHRNTNLNIRGAFLHIVGDALSSVGVIIGGIDHYLYRLVPDRSDPEHADLRWSSSTVHGRSSRSP